MGLLQGMSMIRVQAYIYSRLNPQVQIQPVDKFQHWQAVKVGRSILGDSH